MERDYTIIEDFDDPTNTWFLGNVQLPFQQPYDAQQAGRTQVNLFRKVLEKRDTKEALSGNKYSMWKSPVQGTSPWKR